jgi:multiple sugar transport system permease protein
MESARSKTLWGVATLLILVWTVFPILWIVMLSFKQPGEVGNTKGFLPADWTWVNYETVFKTDLSSVRGDK